MSNVNFYHRKKHSENKTLISLFYSIKGKRLVISTGQSVYPNLWNFEKMRVKGGSQEAIIINKVLDNYEHHIKQIHNKYRFEFKAPSVGQLKRELQKALVQQDVKSTDLFNFIEDLITERDNSPEYSKASIKVYRTTQKHLKKFVEEWGELGFDDIDGSLFQELKSYLFKKKYSGNYVHKLLSTFINFLNVASEREINTNLKYRFVKLANLRETADEIYLTLEELKHLYEFDFSERPGLERVRDVFICACFTGLRYSDWHKIDSENLKLINSGEKRIEVLEILTQKTEKLVFIPLLPYPRAILEKYEGHLPIISNQKTNKALKDMAKIAGLDESITKYQIRAGKKDGQSFPKWKRIFTHTARRSFVSNARKMGIPDEIVKAITGHTTDSSFVGYDKRKMEEIAVEMAGYWND